VRAIALPLGRRRYELVTSSTITDADGVRLRGVDFSDIDIRNIAQISVRMLSSRPMG
jgi:hypothetical protein